LIDSSQQDVANILIDSATVESNSLNWVRPKWIASSFLRDLTSLHY